MSGNDPLRNPKDPLRQASPEAALELFRLFARQAHGFPREAALDAAANLIINALRQAHPTRQEAEKAFDALFGRSKQILSDHYDSLGRKRGVFPYDQVISVPVMDLRKPN